MALVDERAALVTLLGITDNPKYSLAQLQALAMTTSSNKNTNSMFNEAGQFGPGPTPLSLAAASLLATTVSIRPSASDLFTGKSNGSVSTLDSGHSYRLYPLGGTRTPRVVNGKLTFDPLAVAGGYASIDTNLPVVGQRATFTFGAYSTGGGLASIAAMSKNIGDSFDAGTGVPKAPAHFIISPTGWSFGVFDTDNTSLRVITSVTYSTPLTADGNTQYTAEYRLDPEAGIAYLTVPYFDGPRYFTVGPDVGIKTLAYSCFIEPFKQNGLVTESLTSFVSHSATLGTPTPGLQSGILYQPAGSSTISATGSISDVDSVNAVVSGHYGPTGRVFIFANINATIQAAADYYLALKNGTTVVAESTSRVRAPVAADSNNQNFNVMLSANGVPGAAFTLKLAHVVFTGTASIALGTNYSIRLLAVPV